MDVIKEDFWIGIGSVDGLHTLIRKEPVNAFTWTKLSTVSSWLQTCNLPGFGHQDKRRRVASNGSLVDGNTLLSRGTSTGYPRSHDAKRMPSSLTLQYGAGPSILNIELHKTLVVI